MKQLLALMIAVCLVGCRGGPATYQTPQQAFHALGDALATSPDAAERVLGPAGAEILHSGDPVADRNGARRVAAGFDTLTLANNADGSVTALLGATRWPLPIPLVKRGDGRWQFDAAAGREEILNRRIGRNELAAIQVCLAIADAQQDYVDQRPMGEPPRYAGRFISSSGQKDGLYWPTTQPSDPDSPLGDLIGRAADEGYSTSKPQPGERRAYHGYRYHFLPSQGEHAPGGAWDYVYGGKQLGGFAVIAYPAEYGNSGVMSFIVNQSGTVYQKDLGRETESVARQMTSFDPGPGWTQVHAEPTSGPS